MGAPEQPRRRDVARGLSLCLTEHVLQPPADGGTTHAPPARGCKHMYSCVHVFAAQGPRSFSQAAMLAAVPHHHCPPPPQPRRTRRMLFCTRLYTHKGPPVPRVQLERHFCGLGRAALHHLGLRRAATRSSLHAHHEWLCGARGTRTQPPPPSFAGETASPTSCRAAHAPSYVRLASSSTTRHHRSRVSGVGATWYLSDGAGRAHRPESCKTKCGAGLPARAGRPHEQLQGCRAPPLAVPQAPLLRGALGVGLARQVLFEHVVAGQGKEGQGGRGGQGGQREGSGRAAGGQWEGRGCEGEGEAARCSPGCTAQAEAPLLAMPSRAAAGPPSSSRTAPSRGQHQVCCRQLHSADHLGPIGRATARGARARSSSAKCGASVRTWNRPTRGRPCLVTKGPRLRQS